MHLPAELQGIIFFQSYHFSDVEVMYCMWSFLIYEFVCRRWDGPAGIRPGFTSWTTEFDIRQRQEVFLFKIGFGPHRVSVNMGALFPGVSRRSTKLTDNHPLLPKVTIIWRCAFAPPYVLVAWCAGTNYLFLFQFVVLEIFFNEVFDRFLVKFLHPL